VISDLLSNVLGGFIGGGGGIQKRRGNAGWVSCAVRGTTGHEGRLPKRWRGALIRRDRGDLLVRIVPLLPGRTTLTVSRQPVVTAHGGRPQGAGAWGLAKGMNVVEVKGTSVAFELAVLPENTEEVMALLLGKNLSAGRESA
jgi:hypothetical protein